MGARPTGRLKDRYENFKVDGNGHVSTYWAKELSARKLPGWPRSLFEVFESWARAWLGVCATVTLAGGAVDCCFFLEKKDILEDRELKKDDMMGKKKTIKMKRNSS
jgi:hypothetical protein